MLCCVSRRAIEGADQGPPYDHCSLKEQPVELKKVVQVEQSSESDVPPILLPCAICARTFMPQSLEKHSKICEQSTTKKRKPFDSAKQRIQGTELAEFLPRQEKKRHVTDDKFSKPQSTWKQTHDDFLRAIRAARNEVVDPPMQKQGGTTVTPNAPTRANEQGMCPTCNRHFGVKAYDRHVAWCKERIAQVPVSPATNIAKERLEARMKYRAPAVRSRRQATREKYSPGSAITLSSGNKTSPTLLASRAKESVSAPSCNKTCDSPVKQKIAVVRRPGHTRESSNSTVPMKSRPMDRGIRPPEDEAGPITFRPAPPVKRISYLPVPPLKHKKESLEECSYIPSLASCKKQPKRTQEKMKRVENSKLKIKQDEKQQVLHSARSQKASIVSARSQGNPKLNDVSINEDSMGVTVKPCSIHRETRLTTWKQISQEKDSLESNIRNVIAQNSPAKYSFIDRSEEPMENLSLYKQQMDNADLILGEDVFKGDPSTLSLESETINWPPVSPSLNTTYSFRDSTSKYNADDVEDIAKRKKWKPVRHSPRIEFCLGDPEKVSRVNVPPIGFGYPDEISGRSNIRNSSKNLKEEYIKAEGSDRSAMEMETVLNEKRPEEGNSNFGTMSSEITLPSKCFESPKNRIQREKQLEAMECGDILLEDDCRDEGQDCNSFKSVYNSPKKYLGENTIAAGASSNRERTMVESNSLECENSQNIAASGNPMDVMENSKTEILTCPSHENLKPSISFERFAYLDKLDDFCEANEPEWSCKVINNNTEDIREFTTDNDELNAEENEVRDCSSAKMEIYETDIDQNSIHYTQNELDCPTGKENNHDDIHFGNTESNWIEMEAEPFFIKDSLEPARSSTPLVSREASPKPNCSTHENFKRELCPSLENSEWKLEVDPETGSELLYRIEKVDSSCLSSRLSSREKMDKLEKSNSDTSQHRNSASRRHRERNKSPENISRNTSPAIQTERGESLSRIATSTIEEKKETLSRPVSPVTKSEQKGKLPKILKREAASQINICNCPMKVPSSNNCEKNFAQNASPIEDQDCNILFNKNLQDSETAEKFVDVHCRQNIEETNFTSNLNDNPTGESNINLEASNCNCKMGDIIAKMKNNSGELSEIPEESTDKTETVNEDVEEIYKNCSNQDFDCDSDDSIEHYIKDAINGLKSSSKKTEKIKSNFQNLRSIILSESCVKMRQRVRMDDGSTSRSTALKSRRLKKLEIESMNGSSDSLASSMDAIELSDMKQVESVEMETIEEIGARNRSIRFRMLPKIRGTTVVVKENYNEVEKINGQTYWEKASKASKSRLINLDPPYQGSNRFLKRNPKICVLPPVSSVPSLVKHRELKLPLRPPWSNYVRRRPDFNLVLSSRTGKDYDPFLLAEQQMNDLLSDTSEQSATDSPLIEKNRESSFPLSHSSAFVKYPGQSSLSNPEKRSSLIAPPTEFDDLTCDFSSDSTETNSICREVFLNDLRNSKQFKDSISKSDVDKKSPVRELGRRVIIDKSKALGGEVVDDSDRGSRSFVGSSERARKILDKVSPKVVRPAVNRSLSARAASAPKSTPDRKSSNSSNEKRSTHNNNGAQITSNGNLSNRNNNYANLSSSNLSLNSITSSDVDIKRSNSVFDELMTSFEDENGSFASLKSLLKNDSLSVSSPVRGRQRNGQVSDEELSSPESYKRQDHSKMSADSAYSSLNRKYSHHGRSTNDVAGRFDEDASRNNRREGNGVTTPMGKCKMSKFCHECGSKFPETAKFCCECGIRRLVL